MTRIGNDTYRLRPARVGDALDILERVRKVDLEEWEASASGGILHLPNAVKHAAECWCAYRTVTGSPEIIGGVNTGDGDPYAWLIGTDLAERDAWWMLNDTREFWEQLWQRWPTCQCWSDDRNMVHHRWLEWMGFRLLGTEPWGHLGLPFRHYAR